MQFPASAAQAQGASTLMVADTEIDQSYRSEQQYQMPQVNQIFSSEGEQPELHSRQNNQFMDDQFQIIDSAEASEVTGSEVGAYSQQKKKKKTGFMSALSNMYASATKGRSRKP